jgi:hypothetical protein
LGKEKDAKKKKEHLEEALLSSEDLEKEKEKKEKRKSKD